MGRKHVAEFYSAFYFADETVSGKRVAQTAEWSEQTVKQNGGLFDSNYSAALSFHFVMHLPNTVTAAGSLPSLSEHESITTQVTILAIRGGGRIKSTAFSMTWHKHPVSWAPNEHHVASASSVHPANPVHGWPQVVTTRDCKAACSLDLKRSKTARGWQLLNKIFKISK